MNGLRTHIVRCLMAIAIATLCVPDAAAQLPVRTRDLQLISNNNTNYTSLQSVNGQAANWTLVLPPSAGATGSLLTSSVAGTTATMSWLPAAVDGNVLQLSGGTPTWQDLSGIFWALAGNTTTTAWDGVSGSRLGTLTSATPQDLVLVTNSLFRARIVATGATAGNMVLGTLSTAAPVNATAAQATEKLTILGGDMSFNSENNAAITRGIYFNGTAGNGNFRIGSSGGDIFWQGGGGNMLQMGSYWGMRFYGNQAGAGYPAFVGGAATDPTLNLIVTRLGSPGLAITRSAGMTANQQEWRTNAGAVLSMMSPDANLGLGVTTNTVSKLRINASLTTGNAIQIDPWGAAAGNTGEERFLELAASGTNYVGFKAPDALAADNMYTLPNAYPTVNNQVLVSTTTGAMSWATAASLIDAWLLTGNSNAIATSFVGPTTAAMPLNLATSNAVPGDINMYVGAVGAGNLKVNLTSTVFTLGTAITPVSLYVNGTSGTPNVRFLSIGGAVNAAIPAGYDRFMISDGNGNVNQVQYSTVINQNAWALLGNAGTNPATNFLGTTDAQDLVIRTNNTEAIRVLTTGNVGIGTATPSQLLEVEDGNVLISTSGAGLAGEFRMEEDAANGNNYIALKAAGNMANDMTYTMPITIGTANQFLRIAAAPVPTATTATVEWATVTAVATPVVEQFNVPADNTAIGQAANTTYIRLVPDGLAAARTTTIANGTTDGQQLVIRCQAAGAFGVQFNDAGNMRLSGAFNMNNNDSISLIWDGNEGAWIEVSRRNN